MVNAQDASEVLKGRWEKMLLPVHDCLWGRLSDPIA